MKILGIIPARYASTRFEGKPLADIQGKSMIQRVCDQVTATHSISQVLVATDDQRIFDHVKAFGGNVVMTDSTHQSGTDRCSEALDLQTENFDYIINIQGDEPFIQPSQIETLTGLLDRKTEIATLVKLIEKEEQIHNPNTVKVVTDIHHNAMYFSRSPIPYARNRPKGEYLNSHSYYKHIGIYAYRTDILNKLASLPTSELEKTESLEQLRWLENGYTIKTAITTHESIGIDTPEDLEKAIEQLNS